MQDFQCAAASRANNVFRVVHSEQSFHFAVRHNAGIRGCLEQLLHIPVSDEVWQMATLQFSSGGLGLRNAERLCPTAYWASWADTFSVVRRRHPGTADHLMLSLLRNTGGFHLESANECRTRLQGAGIDVPKWGDIDRGQRPGFHPDDEFPRFPRIGWQAFASTPMEEAFFNIAISPRLGQTDQALARSQRGPMASIPFFAAPVSVATRFDPQCFRVLLLRRLWCTQGSWAAVGFLWRVALPESVEKQVLESPKTSGCGSGPPARAKGGQPSLGSGGGRPPTLPWRSVGYRHHSG